MIEYSVLTELNLNPPVVVEVDDPDFREHSQPAATLRGRLNTLRTWLSLHDQNPAPEVLEAVINDTVRLAMRVAVGPDEGDAYRAQNIIAYLSNREDLTEDHITRLFQSYAKEQVASLGEPWGLPLGPNWRTHEVECDLITFLQRETCSVPLLGAAWRTLNFYTSSLPFSKANSKLASHIVANPHTPAVVAARILAENRQNRLLIGQTWKTQVARDFPELADLPETMLVDTVASQPIPAEWFQDAFTVPEGIKQTAPGEIV